MRTPRAKMSLNVTELPPRHDDVPARIEIPEINELHRSTGERYSPEPGDIVMICELGAGNGGTVSLVEYTPTRWKMAMKTIQLDSYECVRTQIQRELKIMHQCRSPHIVSFYGALLAHNEVSLCMEYMDIGSFDRIVRELGAIPIEIVARVALSVLEGLVHLYSTYKIIHRDIKPSNILLNSDGQIKVSDFGVSVQLTDSVAQTFVGTSAYMSPERIEGCKYSVQSDAWSVGITLIELATGRSPFLSDEGNLSVFDLLQIIVREPSPTLPPGVFPDDFDSFVSRCLIKDPALRPSPRDLLSDPYCTRVSLEPVDTRSWALSVKSKIVP